MLSQCQNKFKLLFILPLLEQSNNSVIFLLRDFLGKKGENSHLSHLPYLSVVKSVM